MIKKMPTILLVSAIILCLVLIGTAYAISIQIVIIDSQLAYGSASGPSGSIQFNGNVTSWFESEILPRSWYEWEWITITPPPAEAQNNSISISVVGEALFTVEFPASYGITIQSWSLTNMTDAGTYNVLIQGDGNNVLQVEIVGSSSWAFTLTTNHIPQSEWGSTVPITITLAAGGTAVPIPVNLKI